MLESQYSSVEAACNFDRYVQQDHAKDMIYHDIATKISEHAIFEGSRLMVGDIGCGTGQFVEILQAEIPQSHIVFADISKSAVAMTNNRFASIDFSTRPSGICMNLQDGFPIDDEAFDVLTSHFVISEVPELDSLLQEYYRTLRPGGLGVFSMTSPLSDMLTSILKPGRIQNLSLEKQGEPQMGEYHLSNGLVVPHYYRDYDTLIGSFHKNGLRVTTADMVRYYPVEDGKVVPLPEYLVLYTQKDNRRFTGTSRRRIEYKLSLNNPTKIEDIAVNNGKHKFIRISQDRKNQNHPSGLNT